MGLVNIFISYKSCSKKNHIFGWPLWLVLPSPSLEMHIAYFFEYVFFVILSQTILSFLLNL